MEKRRREAQKKKTMGDELQDRLGTFGARVVDLVEELPGTQAARHVYDQLLRAGTAPGAHYGEARNAQSHDDFVHKVGLAAKEAGEARYWLKIVHRSQMVERDLSALIGEADEVVSILYRSLQTARNSNAE